MMKGLRFLFVLAVVSSLPYGAARLYFHLTEGFSLFGIASTLTYHPQWEVPPLTPEELENVKAALNQPYHYLGRGCQSYALESADGKYVLKFYKHKHLQKSPPWARLFPLRFFLADYLAKRQVRKEEQIDALFQSAVFAFTHMKDLCLLSFVHLNRTKDELPTLKIYDKLHFPHTVALDEHEFILQRKVLQIRPYLEALMERQEEEKAKESLSKAILFLVERSKRGIRDGDRAFDNNFGFFEGQPVSLDVGHMLPDPAIKERDVYIADIKYRTSYIRKWLGSAYPSLAAHLDHELATL